MAPAAECWGHPLRRCRQPSRHGHSFTGAVASTKTRPAACSTAYSLKAPAELAQLACQAECQSLQGVLRHTQALGQQVSPDIVKGRLVQGEVEVSCCTCSVAGVSAVSGRALKASVQDHSADENTEDPGYAAWQHHVDAADRRSRAAEHLQSFRRQLAQRVRAASRQELTRQPSLEVRVCPRLRLASLPGCWPQCLTVALCTGLRIRPAYSLRRGHTGCFSSIGQHHGWLVQQRDRQAAVQTLHQLQHKEKMALLAKTIRADNLKSVPRAPAPVPVSTCYAGSSQLQAR